MENVNVCLRVLRDIVEVMDVEGNAQLVCQMKNV
jgi:hypothetical protein